MVRPGGRVVFVESLSGSVLLRAYRRLTSPRAYRSFTRHLSFAELRECGRSMSLTHARAHYLFSILAFAALFWIRSPRTHEVLLEKFHPIDRSILDHVPFLNRWAWRGTVAFTRSD